MVKRTAEKLDVDARFLLANERTMLAWVRTSLAILAGGIILMQAHQDQKWLGLIVALSGAAVALIGYSRYRAADKAIRAGELPHMGVGPLVEVGLVVVLAIGLSLAQLLID